MAAAKRLKLSVSGSTRFAKPYTDSELKELAKGKRSVNPEKHRLGLACFSSLGRRAKQR